MNPTGVCCSFATQTVLLLIEENLFLQSNFQNENENEPVYDEGVIVTDGNCKDEQPEADCQSWAANGYVQSEWAKCRSRV